MNVLTTPFLDACRRFAGFVLAALVAGAASHHAVAQTIFDHDLNGNRRAQEAAGTLTAPFISTMPADQVAMLGGTARFSVVAGGIGPFSYQWFKGAAPISGAVSDTLAITNLVAGDFTPSPTGAPKYSVQVTNAHSTVSSSAAGLYQDSIGAGLPNWWRQQYFGSLAAVSSNADADGDGVTNGQEYTDGTQPNNASSRLGRVMLIGPPSLMSKFPERETYAAGTVVTASGGSAGEIQFGGWTGSQRATSSVGFTMRGNPAQAGDVVLKGLFGSMPVDTNSAAPSFTNSNGTPAEVNGFATSPDGRWIAFGNFDRVRVYGTNEARPYVARFVYNGSLDPGLDAGFTPAPNLPVVDAAFLPDGKMILSGYFTQISGQPAPGVARFNADGTRDTSFAPPTVGAEFAQVMEIEPQRDGKLLVAGNVWNGSVYKNLLRLNADGSVDSTFAPVPNSPPVVFTQQRDGKILMAGNFTQVNGTPAPKLVRLNPNGTLDSTFNISAGINSVASTVIQQPDGKILVGGAVQVNLNGNNVSVPVARLNANGTLDSAFTQKVYALAANAAFYDMTLQTDGRIVGGGAFTRTSPEVVNLLRLNADGSADPNAFVISRPNAPVFAVASQVDGSLLIGGSFSSIAAGGEPGNNHSYHFTSVKSGWFAAEAEAARLGGRLVSIGGQREQLFLNETLIPIMGLSNRPTWMGLADQGVEGLFAWSSGEPVTFANWHAGNPDNYGGNEDYTTINWGNSLNGTGPGLWNDTPEGGSSGFGGNTDGPYYGVVEVDPAAAAPTTQHWVAGRDMFASEKSGLPTPPASLDPTVAEWSYGHRATAASTSLTLFDRRHVDGIIQGWEATNSCGVMVSNSSVPGFYLGPRPLHPGEMYLHPGNDLECAVVRWTAPQAGTYAVSAFWQDFSWGSGDGGTAHIVVNGVVKFGYTFDNGNGASDARVLTLNSGDVVDFVLGARDSFDSDGTRFNATVTKIQNESDLWVGGRDLALNEKPDGHANETTNPNPTVPQWSYGSRFSLVTSGINLYPIHINTGSAGDDAMEGWRAGDSAIVSNTGATPVTYNFGFGPNLPFNPGEMLLSPGGNGGPFPVLRWTAPTAGRYEILAYWHDIDDHGGNGFSAHLLVNGGQIYAQDSDNGAGSSTVQSLDLKAGDQVDFLMGTRGDYGFDTTKFNVTIVRPASSPVPPVPSGTLSQATTRAEIGVDAAVINWAGAGANNTDVAGNPFGIESSTGTSYLVRKSSTGAFNRLNQGTSWAGNFGPGDALLTHVNNDGPVVIEAANADGVFSAAGMQIQPNQNGPFTATIRAYDRFGVLLGTFTAGGVSNADGDNSAVFMGVKSTVENIHAISVDTDTPSFGGDFAINRVSIRSSPAGSGNVLSTQRLAFAKLAPTNHIATFPLWEIPAGPVYAANAPAALQLSFNGYGQPVSFAELESSTDGITFQRFSQGEYVDNGFPIWNFPIRALPPGANYFRAVLTNTQREQARTHAVGPLVTPPVVTSALAAQAMVGQPFIYQATATGRLTAFTATSLPAWLNSSYDANTNIVTLTGTPATGGSHAIALEPFNAAGSTPATLVLSVRNDFESWRSANFTAAELLDPAISGPLGDATGAGIANLVKYALGIPPKQFGAASLPAGSVQTYGSNRYLTLVYTRDKSVEDAGLVVQVSGNVENWSSGPAYTTEVSRVSNGNTETVTIRDNVPITGSEHRFIRLRVDR